jgi:hypothetical protein
MIDPFVRSGTDHGSQTQQGALPQSQQKAGAEFRAKRTIRPVMASIRRFLATGVPTAPAKLRSDHNHGSGKLFQLLQRIQPEPHPAQRARHSGNSAGAFSRSKNHCVDFLPELAAGRSSLFRE